ncbi:hypothetical protein niasHS_003176 [Heterodera schachtii]|uniref:Uncharacterized protein n=1 Tax=Heterodera schachtii TaxID=97005 RepID=A0ABD2KFQ8_HETSC
MSHNQPKKAKYDQPQEEEDKAPLTDDAEKKEPKADKASLTDDAEEKDKKMTAREILVLNEEENMFDIEVALAAIIGEELIFGQHYDGSESDIEQATRNLKAMIEEDGSTHFDCMRDLSVLTPRPEKQNKYDELFSQKMDACEKRVTEILKGNLDIVKALAKRLSEKHNYRLGKDEIQQFFRQYEADQLPPGGEGEEKAMR